jgi:hypothetical protein
MFRYYLGRGGGSPMSHKSRSFLVFIALTVICCAGFAATAQTKTPLTHEAMWALKRVGPPTPSPDGKWVVFSLVEPAYDEKDQVSDLWIVPADGSAKALRVARSPFQRSAKAMR